MMASTACLSSLARALASSPAIAAKGDIAIAARTLGLAGSRASRLATTAPRSLTATATCCWQ